MQINYRVRGADGQEYGPASLQEMLAWLREGRLLPESTVSRSDLDYWAPAGSFEELAPRSASLRMVQPIEAPAAQPSPGNAAVPVPVATSVPEPSTGGFEAMDAAQAAQLRGGASWFFWIAGLSLINSLAALTGSNWGFILGLGVTQVIDAIAQEIGGAGPLVGFALDLGAAGLFIGFGILARKGLAWSFVVGMILYGLDGLLFLLVGDWFGLAFHVFVLFCLFKGLQATGGARKNVAPTAALSRASIR
jgi:hypothetical protein